MTSDVFWMSANGLWMFIVVATPWALVAAIVMALSLKERQMNFKVPPEKMVKSFGISLFALLAAFALEWLSVADASPVVVAMLGPLVNYLREVKKSFDAETPGPKAEGEG